MSLPPKVGAAKYFAKKLGQKLESDPRILKVAESISNTDYTIRSWVLKFLFGKKGIASPPRDRNSTKEAMVEMTSFTCMVLGSAAVAYYTGEQVKGFLKEEMKNTEEMKSEIMGRLEALEQKVDGLKTELETLKIESCKKGILH